EDWLYPDNFNCYKLESGDDPRVVWSYPGNTWDVDRAGLMYLSKFDRLLSAYRGFLLDLPGRDRLMEARFLRTGGPTSTKTISLAGNRIRVEYSGTPIGHSVANEFSLDHLTMLTLGATQSRVISSDDRTIRLLRNDSASNLRATITLEGDCQFSG